MLIRALIVLLVVLNLGAAAWWLTRPAPTPPAEPALPAGVARLQLLNEAPSIPTQAPVPQARDAVPPAALTACFSLGPYTRESSALQAQAALAGRILHARLREVPGAGTGGYQVVMPPAASLEEAQATAGRIGAAGFDDFLVVRQGEQANGIALGRYGSHEAAQRRQSALQAKGFPAQIQAVGGEGAAQWWLDVTAADGAGAGQLKTLANAAQSRSLDCAALR